MAYSLNRAQLIGNLTSDPEVRQIPSGRTVASFSVATNRSWTDQSGQRQDQADFHNIVCWGKLAEIVSNFLRKGRKVYVEGRLQTRSWQGEDGVKRYKTEIIAENVIMLDKTGDNPTPLSSTPRTMNTAPTQTTQPAATPAPAVNEPAPATASAPANAPADTPTEEVTIDDLPF